MNNTQELRLFFFQYPCHKCGQQEADVRYMGEGGLYTEEEEIKQDLMLRTCRRCGYTWHELPLDYEGEIVHKIKPEDDLHMVYIILWLRCRDQVTRLNYYNKVKHLLGADVERKILQRADDVMEQTVRGETERATPD